MVLELFLNTLALGLWLICGMRLCRVWNPFWMLHLRFCSALIWHTRRISWLFFGLDPRFLNAEVQCTLYCVRSWSFLGLNDFGGDKGLALYEAASRRSLWFPLDWEWDGFGCRLASYSRHENNKIKSDPCNFKKWDSLTCNNFDFTI